MGGGRHPPLAMARALLGWLSRAILGLFSHLRSTAKPLRVSRRLAPGQAGLTLVEVAVAIAIIGITGTTIMGALAGGVSGADKSNTRTLLNVLAQGQLDSIAAQSFRDDGNYKLLSNVPPGYQVSVKVTPIRPGVLQQVTVSVKRGDEQSMTLTTYHSNRLLEIGARPQGAGLEGVRPVSLPAELAPGLGFFQVVQVAPTEFTEELRGRWLLRATPPVGLSTERRSISLSIFGGTPFGSQAQGTSLTPPGQVAGTALASAGATDFVLEAFVPKAAPGQYTLYFFNRDSKPVNTELATAACICPG